MKKFFLLFLLISACLIVLWRVSNSRTFQFSGELISHVPVSDSLIALTFDDGPTPGYTDSILAVLEENSVKATFFVTGVETEENMQEAKNIVSAGHQLGNHSYSHPQMVLKSKDFLENEIDRTDRVIREAGFTGEIYFRPPYCKKLFLLPWVLKQKNKLTITWNIEPESYPEVRNNPQKIADHVEGNVKPGSIILLHLMYEGRETSREALPIIIKRLRERGYKFVTMSELIDQKYSMSVIFNQ